jgi:spore coat polysaccharide biosynthesis protein SpsF (cytidylyltransferase family)
MTCAVIIQARFGSTRLPGKVLLPLGGRPVLASVLERAARIPGIDIVVCAVPEGVPNDPVAAAASACGAVVFRGDERDVLSRYEGAARAVGATVVMRVTSDCPLIDPMIAGEVLALIQGGSADYACNNMPPLWPHGLDCEAFHARHLHRAAAEAHLPYDREHVTPWLRRNPGLRRVNLSGPGGGLERYRWTLDHREDYAFFRALWRAMGDDAASVSTDEILALLMRRPEVSDLNRGRIDEARLTDRSIRADRDVSSRHQPPVYDWAMGEQCS